MVKVTYQDNTTELIDADTLLATGDDSWAVLHKDGVAVAWVRCGYTRSIVMGVTV